MGNKKGIYSGSAQKTYDSDKDLSPEDRKKIKNSRRPDEERKKAWDRAGSYSKIKKMFKSGIYGDTRKKD